MFWIKGDSLNASVCAPSPIYVQGRPIEMWHIRDDEFHKIIC